MPQIVHATEEEIFTISKLAREIWPVVYDYMISQEQISYMLEMMYSKAALQKQFTALGHKFLLLKDNQDYIGFASYSSTENRAICYLQKLYLQAKTQGKGYGVMLLDAVITQSKLLGATHLRLNVNKTNRSVKFYEKQGFRVMGNSRGGY